MTDYLALADTLAADIASGKLAAGTRLLPQREFAWSRGIAVSTASRVYGELVRRGLVTGEVGRGTYVATPGGTSSAALTEPRGPLIDLEYNFPRVTGHEKLLGPGLAGLLRPDVLARATLPVAASGMPAARACVAAFLSRPDWAVKADAVLFAGNGRQAIAAALASAAKPGGLVGVEPLTYAVVKGLASSLGLTLVPIRCDEEGVSPAALASLHRKRPLDAVYVQPTLHNPLGTTWPPARRQAIASLVRTLDLTVIEDGIYSFLSDATPLAALAPEQVIFVDSLSKRLTPGLTIGMLIAPPGRHAGLATALRRGGWMAQRFALEAATRWLTDGTARKIERLKRRDAAERQRLARACLRGLKLRGDARTYHLWLELDAPWRAETFVEAALREGIALAPSSAFAVQAGHSPRAVRLALSGPTRVQLRKALLLLAELAKGKPAGKL